MSKISNCPLVQYTKDRSAVALTHTNKSTKADPPHFILACLTMAQNMRFTSILLLLLAFIFVSPANAYQLYAYKWPQLSTTFYVNIAGAEGLWNDSFETAMYYWGVDTIFEYKIVRGVYEDPCDPPEGRNGVSFGYTNCGDEWGNTTIAITQSWLTGSTLTHTDIVFNNNESWNVYSTSWSSSPWFGINDFQRVAVHELGHALGLDHEDSGVLTIMRTLAGDITIPQQDDVNGVAAIYGSAEDVPDSYTITASAISNGTISPSGTVTVTEGEDQTFTITADANYHVADVKVDNISVGAVTTHTFTNVTANHTIEATFTEETPVPEIDSNGGGDGGGGGGCFIATAAYGSSMEPHVTILREFRDGFLLNNSIGKVFIQLYYTYSPPIANFIAKHANLRAITRLTLLPIVGMSWVALKMGPEYSLAIMLLLCSVLIGFMGFRRKFMK